MQVKDIKTRIFVEGENITDFIIEHIEQIDEESIIIVASKIVALSERRTVEFKTEKEKISIIQKESESMLRTQHVFLTVKDGSLMANAGVDESNADGKLILLPKDSFLSAKHIRTILKKYYGLKHLGVVITDSRTVQFRAGVIGVALGYAGFYGIRDYKGSADIFGRIFTVSRMDIADSIAATAVLVMGEGNERKPLVAISDAPVKFCNSFNKKELFIPIEDDMYLPFFKKLK